MEDKKDRKTIAEYLDYGEKELEDILKSIARLGEFLGHLKFLAEQKEKEYNIDRR